MPMPGVHKKIQTDAKKRAADFGVIAKKIVVKSSQLYAKWCDLTAICMSMSLKRKYDDIYCSASSILPEGAVEVIPRCLSIRNNVAFGILAGRRIREVMSTLRASTRLGARIE